MYQEIPAETGSPHGLSIWKSKRLEAKLERSHMDLAHFANTGMTEALADALTLRGTCEDNLKVRHRNACISGMTKGAGPNRINMSPPFMDHSMLHHINRMANERGMSYIFPGVLPLPSDNGERFLSTYMKQQELRKIKYRSLIGDDQCPCPGCKKNPFPLEGVLSGKKQRNTLNIFRQNISEASAEKPEKGPSDITIESTSLTGSQVPTCQLSQVGTCEPVNIQTRPVTTVQARPVSNQFTAIPTWLPNQWVPTPYPIINPYLVPKYRDIPPTHPLYKDFCYHDPTGRLPPKKCDSLRIHEETQRLAGTGKRKRGRKPHSCAKREMKSYT